MVHRRFDSGLGEVASFRAFAGLIKNIIDAALFLDGQCLEDGPARLPFGRDLVDATEFHHGPMVLDFGLLLKSVATWSVSSHADSFCGAQMPASFIAA